MDYKIIELFKSRQGEGYNFGKECIFIRFAGCNLNCPWCDTQFNGKWVDSFRKTNIKTLTEDEIYNECLKLNCFNIILTGGEPTVQDLIPLLKKFNNKWWIGIETNGLNPIPKRIDWVSCSPKYHFKDLKLRLNMSPLPTTGEFRLVVDNESKDYVNWVESLLKQFKELKSWHWYLSPCAKNDWKPGDIPEFDWNKLITIYNILKEKRFKISIQTHKLMNIR